MKLAVLNPGGNDPDQEFPDGAGPRIPERHAPVNFHAFAACTGGSFHSRESSIPKDRTAVLLLLRHDLGRCRQALIELRRARKTVAVTLKEAGTLQVAALLRSRGKLKLLREICERAHAAIATTEELVPLYRALGARAVEFIPTPYPIDDPRWDFTHAGERRGVFLGTREFRTFSRNHLSALLLLRNVAESMGQPVTVVNSDGWRGRRLLSEARYPEGLLDVRPRPLPYFEYLAAMARRRLVFQLDASAVPGQVAGDALLCGIPCVGGNGAVERMTFPHLCGYGRPPEELIDLTTRLLDHPHDCETAAQGARLLAGEKLSFAHAALRLRQLYGQLA